MPAAALTNPDWGVNQSDVNALTQRAIPVLVNIQKGMAPDARYGGYATQVSQMISDLTALAQTVQDYLAVQGT